jgi:hypothetical protein
MTDTLQLQEAAESGLPGTTCCPLPSQPGYIAHMRERNRREGIEPEPYRAAFQEFYAVPHCCYGWEIYVGAQYICQCGSEGQRDMLLAALNHWRGSDGAFEFRAKLFPSDNRELYEPKSVDNHEND